MSKGGGGDQTSTVYQSSLPQYAEPFYKQLMTRGVAESTRPYQPYNAPRLAGPDRLTNQGIAQASAFGRSNLGMLPGAERLTQQVGNKAYGLSSYGSKFQPGQFGSAEASQYMSPYMDAVTERAKAGAAQDYAEQRVFNQSDAARAGAFGGSRQAVMDAIAQRSLMDRMSDITVQGRQSAFENAQQQYERDSKDDQYFFEHTNVIDRTRMKRVERMLTNICSNSFDSLNPRSINSALLVYYTLPKETNW
jgi:hypothetical protein